MPLVRRTRATLRSAEFGFFGVWVNTRTQTPRFCGLSCSAGLFVLVTIFLRPARTSWLIVGIFNLELRNADCECGIVSDWGLAAIAFAIRNQSAIRIPRSAITRSHCRFRPRSLTAWRLKTL